MRTHNSLSLLVLLLATACKGEEGIDRTTITGQIQLTPAYVDEGDDGNTTANDDGLISMPALTYRYMVVSGSSREWRDGSNRTADVDTYLFRTDGAGHVTMKMTWATDEELVWPSHDDVIWGGGPYLQDTIGYQVEIIDPAWIDDSTGDYHVYATFDDTHNGGVVEWDWADVSVADAGGGSSTPYADGVPAGTQLGVRISAMRGQGLGDDTYTLELSGLDPNDGDVLVGAYMSSDPTNRGNPVAGARANGFWFDDATKSWFGWYAMESSVKRVVECTQDSTEPECADSITSDDPDGQGQAARSYFGGGGGGGGGGGSDTGAMGDTGAGSDGGTADGGTADGGTADGGTADGGSADGGSADGGSADGGSADGGSADGGSADGGSADGGSADGGSADGGSADGGTDEEPRSYGYVNEGVNAVYIMGGTFASLNGSIPGGTYYSSTPVFVQLPDANVVVSEMLQVDDLSPKVYGWTYTEQGDSSEEAPEVVPDPATGAGYVDVIEGSLNYPADDPGGAGTDYDAFIVTTAEELDAIVTLYWYDASTNLDIYVLSGGDYLAAGYLVGDVDGGPETFTAYAHFGFTFQPGVEYEFLIAPWSGPAGDKPYTLEVEWTSP